MCFVLWHFRIVGTNLKADDGCNSTSAHESLVDLIVEPSASICPLLRYTQSILLGCTIAHWVLPGHDPYPIDAISAQKKSKHCVQLSQIYVDWLTKMCL